MVFKMMVRMQLYYLQKSTRENKQRFYTKFSDTIIMTNILFTLSAPNEMKNEWGKDA